MLFQGMSGKAVKSRGLERSLKVPIPREVLESLEKELEAIEAKQ